METNDNDFLSKIPPGIHQTKENYDFVALYDEWKNQRLQLRCHSIFSELVVHSNGDVPLCQNLDVILGNIHHNTLDEIFNSRPTRKTQCRYSNTCNNCWINYHRKYDIILLRNLEKVFPKRLIELFYGKYQSSQQLRFDRLLHTLICSCGVRKPLHRESLARHPPSAIAFKVCLLHV